MKADPYPIKIITLKQWYERINSPGNKSGHVVVSQQGRDLFSEMLRDQPNRQ
jgi:hypothetical protein